MSETNTNGCGTGFFGLLTLLFVGLKLTGYITWSWWWVLSPIPIVCAVGAVIFVIAVVLYAAYKYITE